MLKNDKERYLLTSSQVTAIDKMVSFLYTSPTSHLRIIEWASPIPFFGDPSKSKIATVGLNPSNREFLSASGHELGGNERRFHTLQSLDIGSWDKASPYHLHNIHTSCTEYFYNNPYDGWFRALDNILSSTSCSFYSPLFHACHLDLIPYATYDKWSKLSQKQKSELLKISKNFLGEIIKESSIEILILNGKSVVETFSLITDIHLNSYKKEEWTLPRNQGAGVTGVAYEGEISRISGISLGKKIKVLGYNHNIQSSFGVTNKVRSEITIWINEIVNGRG